MLAIDAPFPQFYDLDGRPLDGGYIYVGAENQNPQTSPITVYWDEALTQPAAQPLRTKNGIIARNGTPAFVYAAADHSMLVLNIRHKQVVYARSSQTFSLASQVNASIAAFRADLLGAGGSTLVGFTQEGDGAILRTLQDKGREVVSILDFGGVGDGVTDESEAYAKASAAADGRAVYFPGRRVYNLDGMPPATGLCRLVGDGDATIIGFNWTDLNADRQDSAVTVSESDSHFEACGLTFRGVDTTPGLTIKNQSQAHVIRSARVSGCVFRGTIGLVLDNAQGCQIESCDFIHNQYGLKTFSATNNTLTGCNFYSPIVGVQLDTSTDDTAGRQGGENLKLVNCMMIDGVMAIRCYKHNYLWLSSCTIDYFNSGIQLFGSKFARLETTYIGCNDNDKSAMPNYIPVAHVGCGYVTGDAASNRSSGIECINSEFVAYGLSSQPCLRLAGADFTFAGVEEVDLVGCRFSSDNPASTLTTLLTMNTVNDVYMAGNKFFSAGNNNVTAPWVFSNMTAGRFVIKDNNYVNVYDSVGTNKPPATGNAGNEILETAQIILPTNGTPVTDAVAYTYRQKYAATPRVIATARSGPVASELLNAGNSSQDATQVFLKAAHINGTNMAAGGSVVVDVIVAGA